MKGQLDLDVWLKDFDIIATVVQRGGGGIGKRGSLSDGSGLRMVLGVLFGVIAGATGIGDRGGLWAATVRVFELSESELIFSEVLNVCTVDPVSINFEFSYETGGA